MPVFELLLQPLTLFQEIFHEFGSPPFLLPKPTIEIFPNGHHLLPHLTGLARGEPGVVFGNGPKAQKAVEMTFQSFGPCKLRSWTINNWQGAGAVHHGKSQLLRPWHSAFRAFCGFASHDRNVLLVEIPQNSPFRFKGVQLQLQDIFEHLEDDLYGFVRREPPCIGKPVVEEGSHVEPIPFGFCDQHRTSRHYIRFHVRVQSLQVESQRERKVFPVLRVHSSPQKRPIVLVSTLPPFICLLWSHHSVQLDNDVDLICRVIPVVLDTLNQQQSLFCGILTFEDIGTLPFTFRNPQSVEKVQSLEDPRLSNLPSIESRFCP